VVGEVVELSTPQNLSPPMRPHSSLPNAPRDILVDDGAEDQHEPEHAAPEAQEEKRANPVRA